MAPWTWVLLTVLVTRSSANLFDLVSPWKDEPYYHTNYEVKVDDTNISPSLTQFYKTVTPAKITTIGKNPDGGDFINNFVGYSLAGSIIIDNGAAGAIVIDTTDSTDVTARMLADFRLKSQSSIHAMVYTHMHADHVYGARTFYTTNTSMQVVAHKNWPAQATELATTPVSRQAWLRANRVFGLLLSDAQRGQGQGVVGYRFNNGGAFVFPNSPILNNVETRIIAGLEVTFYYAPGETVDMIGLTVVDSQGKKYLFCGDDFYSVYPNVYAVRGIGRDILTWIAAIDTLIATNADYLIPSHTNSIEGQATVFQTLTNYRDAILYVYHQTIYLMNQGYEPEEIVAKIKLPTSLANDPNLHENYGMIKWVSKWAFESFAGWFSGNALDLEGFSRNELAKRIVDCHGSIDLAAVSAKTSYNKGDYHWAAYLADLILRISPDNKSALKTRYLAMKAWAGQQDSMNGRFYIMTAIMELHGGLQNNPVIQQQGNLQTNSHEVILKEFDSRIKANEICAGYVINGKLTLTDPAPPPAMTATFVFGLQMRNGIVQYKAGGLPSGVTEDFTISATGANWRSVLINNYFTPKLSTSGAIGLTITGADKADQFYACFNAYPA